jgi:hypothetical protein
MGEEGRTPPQSDLVLGLGLHVVEAPPPYLGVRRRVAVHLEQHDAEEAVPVLFDRHDVKGGGPART